MTEALQRERADAINLRRRHEEQITSLRSAVKSSVVKDLLPVIDNFERALKHIPEDLKGNEYKSLSAYLTTICKNLWHKFLSQEENRGNRENWFGQETELEVHDVSILLSEKEKWDRYLKIFEDAGKHCKQIFELWLVDGMNGKEIAEVMISEGKLKSEQSVRNTKSDCLEKISFALTK